MSKPKKPTRKSRAKKRPSVIDPHTLIVTFPPLNKQVAFDVRIAEKLSVRMSLTKDDRLMLVRAVLPAAGVVAAGVALPIEYRGAALPKLFNEIMFGATMGWLLDQGTDGRELARLFQKLAADRGLVPMFTWPQTITTPSN